MTSIRIAGYHNRKSVQSRAVDVLGAALCESLGDEINFRFDSNISDFGHLGYELLDLVELGEVDVCYVYSSYLNDRVPELGLFELPYQVRSREIAYGLLDGAVGRSIRQAIETRTGYRLLAYWDNGIRHISNSRHVIRRPSDCSGLKIRTTPNKLHQAAFRALGFEPIYCDVTELAAAARDGVIDAQENPLTNLTSYGLEEYHRFVSLTGHICGVNTLIASQKTYASWPDRVKQALSDAVAKATVAQRRMAAEADVVSTEKLLKAGTTITELTEDERGAFAAAVSPLVEAERERFDPQLVASFDSGRM